MEKSVNDKLKECLNQRYTSVEDGKKWNTPYGISFGVPDYTGYKGCPNLWYLFYDKEISAMVANDCIQINGLKSIQMDNDEILYLVTQLDKKETSFSVATKPDAVVTLESIYGVEAKFHNMLYLHWHINVPKVASFINNPFDMKQESATPFLFSASATGESQFEVFFDKDHGKMEFADITDVLPELRRRGLVPAAKFCRGCGVISPLKPLLKCSRCKKAYYCDKECQTEDWSPNHKAKCY